ncbi:hypothetical protein [Desulfofundulus australicus]|uniref:hypothetical protein n=1 Tax=Desulfofundulus australicus TaxID=1566 RepID=UPI00104210F4|nr:hypothetical protein [Desulfofundulus australicus]
MFAWLPDWLPFGVFVATALGMFIFLLLLVMIQVELGEFDNVLLTGLAGSVTLTFLILSVLLYLWIHYDILLSSALVCRLTFAGMLGFPVLCAVLLLCRRLVRLMVR